jgi:hypothetical protein
VGYVSPFTRGYLGYAPFDVGSRLEGLCLEMEVGMRVNLSSV